MLIILAILLLIGVAGAAVGAAIMFGVKASRLSASSRRESDAEEHANHLLSQPYMTEESYIWLAGYFGTTDTTKWRPTNKN